jgi:hypothetical protein
LVLIFEAGEWDRESAHYIDVGTNNSEEFSVEPGQQKISIKMGWSESNEIIIQSDFGKTSTLSNN